MRKLKLLVLALSFIAMGIISSCSEEDLGPAPVTEFGASYKVALLGETITFTNNSAAADGGPLTFAWDFGDGSTSTAANPTKIYASTGEFNVTLTATTASGASTVMSEVITIGEMYLKDVEIFDFIETFTFVDTVIAGDTTYADFFWDDDESGPDLYWILYDQNDESDLIQSPTVINNASNEDIVQISPPAATEFKLKNSSYAFLLIDDDGDEDQSVYAIGFNPTTNTDIYRLEGDSYVSGRDPITGEGLIYLPNGYNTPYEFGLADVFIHFEIK